MGRLLAYLAIAGDVIYILWIIHNGIDEGAQGMTPVGIVALIGLSLLLSLNAVLLYGRSVRR